MLVLGIETSCDETSVAVVEVTEEKITVHTNVVSSQIAKHAPFGGVVPSLAAREHVKNLPTVLKAGLGKFSMTKVDLIAVTSGPGLISSLLVGTAFAKTLAYRYKKPIIGVNHMEGHIASNWLRPIREFSIFPALCLIVSGGHTQLALMETPRSSSAASYAEAASYAGVATKAESAVKKATAGRSKYKLIGETVDDAAGEAFDKIARILGLGYPGGPAIAAKTAEAVTRNTESGIKLPRPMLNSKDYNFSFAGLKTAVLYLVRNLLKETKKQTLDQKTVTAIAREAQAAIVDVLVQKTVRAAKEYEVKSIMLSGGVSANKLLRQELTSAGEKLNLPVLLPAPDYTTDNAAMIALAGFFNYRSGKKYSWKSIKADANWEIV